MHADRCDKSNDISVCNLKEFECIQEYKNNSVFLTQDSRFKNLKKYFLEILNLDSGLRFKIQESERLFSGNLES